MAHQTGKAAVANILQLREGARALRPPRAMRKSL
jgi:hypothetical protein